jgi:myo-inositol-1(or 4)-monophosphatase
VFCVTIGVEHRGEVVAGGTLSPATNELFLAEKGAGATRNGERIRVSDCRDIDKALLVTGFPYDRREHIGYYMAQYGAFLRVSQGVMRFGSAGLDFAHVAMGRLEGYWERGLHPWDVAAGKLLIEEAGDGAMLEVIANCPPWDG